MVLCGMDVYYNLIIYPPFDGHLHSFQVFLITNNAAETSCISHFGHMCEYFSKMNPSNWNCWMKTMHILI